MTWRAFNFRDLPLSAESRSQLAGIYEFVCSSRTVPAQRLALTKLIVKNAYDSTRGVYVPVSEYVELPGKLPVLSEKLAGAAGDALLEPFIAPYFSNALVIPKGYGSPSFRLEHAAKPMLRATNVGFLVATLEFDGATVAQLEETMAWTRGGENAALAKVDSELTGFKDYRGYSVVFSGNRSLHFHFIFSTEHLQNAPFKATVSDRLLVMDRQSALLHNAHTIYWDHVRDAFLEILKPTVQPDHRLRSLTQWRRAPWGVRTLDEGSSILGLNQGTVVPQIVIHENIRSRAARGSADYLVPQIFSCVSPSRPRSPRKHRTACLQI